MLHTAFVGVMFSGCVIPTQSENDQTNGNEVVAINQTDVQRTLTVQVEDENRKTIFQHEYSLEPEQADQSQSTDTDLNGGVITVSEPEFGTLKEPFLPLADPENPHSDIPPETCENMDIVVGVEDQGLYVTYGCP